MIHYVLKHNKPTLRKNFIDIVGCYEDGEFGCW